MRGFLSMARLACLTLLVFVCRVALGAKLDKFPVDEEGKDVPQKMRLRQGTRKCPTDVGSCGSDTFKLPVDNGQILITAHGKADQVLCLGAVSSLPDNHQGRHKWDNRETWAHSCGKESVQLCVDNAVAFEAIKVYCDDGTPGAECGSSAKSRPGRYRRLAYTVAYSVPSSCANHARPSAKSIAKAVELLDSPEAEDMDTINADDEVRGNELAENDAAVVGDGQNGDVSAVGEGELGPWTFHDDATLMTTNKAKASDVDMIVGDSAPWGAITALALTMAAAMFAISVRGMRGSQNVKVAGGSKRGRTRSRVLSPARRRGFSKVGEGNAPRTEDSSSSRGKGGTDEVKPPASV